MKLKIFCLCSLFPSWSGEGRISTPENISFDASLVIQGVPGGKDLTSGECSLGQTIPI